MSLFLKDILQKYESSSEPLSSEIEINSAIAPLLKDTPSPAIELLAEAMAFDFVENYPSEKCEWGTYFGPCISWRKEDGTVVESPSIKKINKEIIDYWEKRAKESPHPVLKARYAGLVWDFSKKITDITPSFAVTEIYVRSLVQISKGNYLKYECDVIKKLERAMQVAISLNNESLIEMCRNAVLEYEDIHGKDEKPGYWGISYDFLLLQIK